MEIYLCEHTRDVGTGTFNSVSFFLPSCTNLKEWKRCKLTARPV